MDIWRPEQDSIHKQNDPKMITSQECLQIKRDLEAKYSDFEVSPMTLSLMITFLLFGIGFWIWMISWSCIFEKPMANEKCTRLTGGKSNRSPNTEGRFSSPGNGDSPGITVHSQLLRQCPPITYQEIPDFDHISLPAASNPESNRPEASVSSTGPTLSTANKKETLLRCEVGTPRSYGSTASSLEMQSLEPRKKYNIQWTKLLGRVRQDDSDD